MNKSILKHEIRSMKWMILLSILASLFLTIMFSTTLDSRYINIFSNGIYLNEALIQSVLRDINEMTLVIFTALSIIQIFMQFRSEKSQETGRFLKSLPVKKEEFFKIKLSTGLINLSLAFIVLAIGLIIVRANNMFWIKDIHSISYSSKAFIKADSAISLLKELGLIYLVVLSFYTFLFMVQYSFSNVVGGIVTGILVWLAPIFIVTSSMYTLDRLSFIGIYNSPLVVSLLNFGRWLLPWSYVLDRDYNVLPYETNSTQISIISSLGIKYTIALLLILINIIIAYKFNKSSKVENENKIIVFKSIRKIFIFGVTICSGLLVSTILHDIIMIQIPTIIYSILILLGGFIGYWISQKITKVGNI
ncbi:hypothetical protein [Tissierella creatinophila]|uniref:ABC-2 family transporter protein n=1 Tax=Tissierella creatinophila DSM 6911 TaxID=1123403 RepID=A0A1U7M6B3_TISCR|nr:hypothetical protein [Tissierella creatinophila]OLS02759.1 ABC-2 family transporter protein [Tissierella creatinophila DSM 6911]